MQDPAAAAPSAVAVAKAQFPEPEQQLKCPRCDSSNTKFCYYNNYNLSQPRHFCKDCRRYWTKGGALRNIPVGGGTRKNSKRSSSSSHSTAPPAAKRSSPSNSCSPTPSTDATANPSSAPLLPTQFPKPEAISVMYPLVDHEDRLLDINGSFSSLLASNGNFLNLLESFTPNESGVMGVPNSTDLNRSVVGDSGFGLQSSSDSNGNENSASESLWPGGWPDLAIYTPGSGFQ